MIINNYLFKGIILTLSAIVFLKTNVFSQHSTLVKNDTSDIINSKDFEAQFSKSIFRDQKLCVIQKRQLNIPKSSQSLKKENPINTSKSGRLSFTTYNAYLLLEDKHRKWDSTAVTVNVFKKKEVELEIANNFLNRLNEDFCISKTIEKGPGYIYLFDFGHRFSTLKNDTLNEDQTVLSKNKYFQKEISKNNHKKLVWEDKYEKGENSDKKYKKHLSDVNKLETHNENSSIIAIYLEHKKPHQSDEFKKSAPIRSETNYKSINIITEGLIQSNGKNISKTRIRISREGKFYRDLFTDTKGRFKIILNRNELYQIEAIKNEYNIEKRTIVPGQMASSPKGIFLTFELKKENPDNNLTSPKLEIHENFDSDFTKTPHQKKSIEILGVVLKENKLVINADIKIFEKNKLILNTKSNNEGEFSIVLPINKKYTFRISKENYKSELIDFEPKIVKQNNQLPLTFKLKKFKEKNDPDGKIHFIVNVTSKGKALQNVNAEIFIEGDEFINLKTNEFGRFTTNISLDNLYTLILKKEDYYSNQISFFPNQKKKTDTLILNFDMPIRNSVIKRGIVTANYRPINKAEIQIYEDGILIKSSLTDEFGAFKIELRSNQEYNLIINKINYFNKELKVSTLNEKGESDVNIYAKIEPFQTNQYKRIENIFFEQKKSSINFFTKQGLNRLSNFLKSNPKIEEIEINVHTDNRGSKSFNKKLSQKRAEACAEYLISTGIPEYKLKVRGYGETRPIIESPLNEDEHYINSRVEFKITKIKK